MTKKFVCVVTATLGVATCCAAMPAWYGQDTSNRYPGYFVGKGFAPVKKGGLAEAARAARENALRDASETIACRVSGETINMQWEEVSGNQARANEVFVSETKVKTDIELLNTRTLETERDRKHVYVMVGVPRTDMQQSYKRRIEQSIKEVGEHFALAERIKATDPGKAIKTYEKCVATLQRLAEDMTLYLFLNQWKDDVSDRAKGMVSRQTVEAELARLAGTTPKSADALATELLAPFFEKKPGRGSFVMYPMEYGNTGFVSPFGSSFAELLAVGIAGRSGWARLPYADHARANTVFRGKLLESEKGMYLVLSARSRGVGSEQANRMFVNKVTCDHIGWDTIRPENLSKALQNKLALYNAIQKDARLKVELQTDKMSDGPVVYRFGEKPKLLVRANKDCYVRIIYVFADNMQTLLIDNYPVPLDRANEWVELPLDLEVCAPSGVEQMLMQASHGERMPALRVTRRLLPDGAHIDIIGGAVSAEINRTRGLKIAKPRKQITEQSYQWTVLAK